MTIKKQPLGPLIFDIIRKNRPEPYHFHQNFQNTILTVINLSLRFFKIDLTRKNRPESFVIGKTAFFEMLVSNHPLRQIEKNL